jgi:hypothetical protein
VACESLSLSKEERPMMSLLMPVYLFFGVSGISDVSAKPPHKYEGIAWERKTGLPVYKEEHEDVLEYDRRIGLKTIYRDMQNNVIAKRIVSFRENETIATFQTEDLRDGYVEGAKVSGDSVHMFWRRNLRTDVKEKTIHIPPPAVVDAGFNNFVQQHWDELLGGSTIHFNFGAPFALDYYPFRIFKKSELTVEGRKRVVMQCDIDNFIIRLFVTPILLTYDVNARRLAAYEGISNVNNNDGRSYFVKIQYNPFGP